MKQFAVFTLAALLASSALDVPCRAQSFTPTGSMAVERVNHQATLLATGSVLVTGGFTLSGYTNTAELYDPAFGTWRSTRRPELGGGPLLLNAARADHTATLLADGRVLIAGGGNQSSSLASAEIFDPVSETFTLTGSLNLARHTHTAAALQDGRVMVIAGNSTVAPCCYSVASTEIYSPATGSWIYAASVPTSGPGTNSTGYVFQAAVLLPDGKVLVTGGHDGFTEVVSSAVMRYDPGANSWQVMGPMLQARMQHTATLLKDGRVLVVGGRLPTARLSLITTEFYDPAASPSGVSVAGAPLTNSARAQHKSTLLLDGTVLVSGGLEFDEAAPYSRSNSSGQLYDPATGNWTEVGPMNSPRAAHTSTLLASGKVLITGGVPPYNYLGSIPVLKTAELYGGPAPSTGTIEVSTNLAAATFTITGPATYNGSGTSFMQSDAPSGAYTIAYGSLGCFVTPPSEAKDLVAGSTVRFSGQYMPISWGSLVFNVSPASARGKARFRITPPIAGITGTESLPLIRNDVPAGTYTISFDPVVGYETAAPLTFTIVPCAQQPTVVIAKYKLVPVVLIHGINSDPTTFGTLKELMEGDGYRVANFDYSGDTGFSPFTWKPITRLAFDLGKEVKELLASPSMQAEDAEHVDIVAHSMGGLVARAWMASGDGLLSNWTTQSYGGQVRRLVTIGTPHYGTPSNWADAGGAFALSGGARQSNDMKSGSSFIWNLHCLWNKNQNAPLPPESMLFIAGTRYPDGLPLSSLWECQWAGFGVGDEGCADGVVDISSAVLPDTAQSVRYLPYRHSGRITPIGNPTIAGVNDRSHPTYKLVSNFLAGRSLPDQQTDIGYMPPHLRGEAARLEGLLLLRFVDKDTMKPIDTSKIKFEFDPTQKSNSYRVETMDAVGTATVLGLRAQTYSSIRVELKGYKDDVIEAANIQAGRPTVMLRKLARK